MDIIYVIIFSVIGYLLGSIPFGLVLTKFLTGEDIRQSGSGNIGATNVMRSGKRGIAALTLVLDAAKAWLAVYLAIFFTDIRVDNNVYEFYPSIAALASGFSALIGHMFPVWLKFKGGKGVACYFGMLLGLSTYSFLVAGVIWLSIFVIKKTSSISALFTCLFVPFWMFIFTDIIGAAFVAMASILIFWRHKDNIARLRKGEEGKL